MIRNYLLLAQEVPDLDGGVAVGDGSVDGEVSVDEPHLVAVSLGDAGDEVLDVGDGGADGGHGASGAEPGVNLELPAALLQLEVEVEVLEVAGELPAGALHRHHLGGHLHRDLLRDVHRLRRQNGLHLGRCFFFLLLLLGDGGAAAAEARRVCVLEGAAAKARSSLLYSGGAER
jgi:hypothetical protein